MMGRNDVTQTITGVRNVFVDYPELAFQLFSEAVPAGYISPSSGFTNAYTVTATVNNDSWGTVVANGYTITATPVTGYYVEGYTLTSGTASVTRTGNVFTVAPTSDCNVQINFAPKSQVTITYLANGAQYATETVFEGEAMTLPSSATAVDGWTLSGWSTSTIEETTAKPSYFALGSSFTPAENTTFYAVYTQTTDGSGDSYYNMVDSSEDLVAGQYLIVYTTGSFAMDGSLDTLDNPSNYIQVTIDQNRIASNSTTDASSFTIDPEAGTIRSASGYYIGATSNSNSLSSSTTTVYTNTINFTNGEATIVGSGGAYLRFNKNDGQMRFRYYKSSTYTQQEPVYLFLKDNNSGVTTYTTNPTNEAHVHSLTHFDATAPTCGSAGNIEYWYCSGCGKYYSDTNAENEISQADTVIAATGEHMFRDYISNDNGTHTRTCSVCGTEETTSCSYEETVIAPTPAEQGYTTHTCTLCGYSFNDSFTPALGCDYKVSFSVPDGVEEIEPMTSNTNSGITLPIAGAPEGYTFLGWVTTDYDNVETRPTGILTGTYIAPNDICLIALYQQGESADEYVLVTDPSSLIAGDKIVITANDTSNQSMSIEQRNNNRGSVEGVKSEDHSIFTPADSTAILTLGEGTVSGTWSFYDPANSGYLYAASTSRNYLRTKGNLDDNGSFTIAISDSDATITAKGTNTHNIIRYNSTRKNICML